VDGWIGGDARNVDVQRREAILGLDNAGREHDAAKILIACVCGYDGHVSDDRIVNPRGNFIDLTFCVDDARHLVLAANRERYFGSAACIFRRGLVVHGCLDESLRRSPQRKHAFELRIRVGLGRRSRRIARSRWNVPRIVAADDLYLTLLAKEWAAAASWHDRTHLAHQFDTHAARVVVHRCGIALYCHRRPSFSRGVVLSDRKILSRPCELKRLDPGCTQSVGCCLHGIRLRSNCRRKRQNSEGREYYLMHIDPPITVSVYCTIRLRDTWARG